MISDNIHIARARILLEQQRFKDAEREASLSFGIEPENAEAFQIIGRCKLETNRVGDAIASLEIALSKSPEDDYTFYLLAFVFFKKRSLKKALGYIRNAISLNNHNADYFSLEGSIFLKRREYEKALEAADEGLKIDAQNVSCLNIRSAVLKEFKMTLNALETSKDALKIDPNSSHTHTVLAFQYLEDADHKSALEHFTSALRNDPDNPIAREGYVSALKAKFPLFRLAIQLGNMDEQTQTFRWMYAVVLIILQKVIAYLLNFGGFTDQLLGLAGAIFILIFFIFFSSSLANIYLLFTKHGKLILTAFEKKRTLSLILLLLISLSIFICYKVVPSHLLYAGIILFALIVPINELNVTAKFDITTATGVSVLLVLVGFVCMMTLLFQNDLKLICTGIVLSLLAIYMIAYRFLRQE